MPPRIKVTERTEVEPAFLDVLVEIWKERWKTLNNEIKTADPRFRDMTARNNAPLMSRLRSACTNPQALDHEKTQLVCLPFVKFSTLSYNGELWMVGLTKPIVLADLNGHRWQGPRYTIYIPRNVIGRGTGAKFHFVPQGFELDYARHPHHNATGPVHFSHPLDMSPSTCWGTFGTIATSCIRGGDMINLFRSLQIYLSRVDMSSLLTHPFDACKQFKPLHS